MFSFGKKQKDKKQEDQKEKDLSQKSSPEKESSSPEVQSQSAETTETASPQTGFFSRLKSGLSRTRDKLGDGMMRHPAPGRMQAGRGILEEVLLQPCTGAFMQPHMQHEGKGVEVDVCGRSAHGVSFRFWACAT